MKYNLLESFYKDFKNDASAPSIKIGDTASFEAVLDHLGYDHTKNYRGNQENIKYSISHQLNTLPSNRHYSEDTKNRRKLKQAFMLTADHNFFKKEVHPVFWFGWSDTMTDEEEPQLLKSACLKYKTNIQNYEVSAVGYLDPIPDKAPTMKQATPFGFEIEGRITYAVTLDAWTNERASAHPRVKSFYANDGRDQKDSYDVSRSTSIPIRPATTENASYNVVLGKDTPTIVGRDLIGEVVVDHWKVKSVIVNLHAFASSNGINPTPENKQLLIKVLNEIEDNGTCFGLPAKTIGPMGWLRRRALKRIQ